MHVLLPRSQRSELDGSTSTAAVRVRTVVTKRCRSRLRKLWPITYAADALRLQNTIGQSSAKVSQNFYSARARSPDKPTGPLRRERRVAKHVP